MREGHPPPTFFTLPFIAEKSSLLLNFNISAFRQDIRNLVGKFEAIYVRNMHANFQALSFPGMAGK